MGKMAILNKSDFMVQTNELKKCIMEMDDIWHELSQQQHYLAGITGQTHGHAYMSIDVIEQQSEWLRQECADARELLAGLRAIYTFYEKNERMIIDN